MVATVMATAAGLLWAAPTGAADPNFTYYPPDLGTYHTWCITGSVPFGDVRRAMGNAMTHVGNNTNVRQRRVDCVASGSGQTDVRFRIATDPGFPITYGRAWCQKWNSKGLCDRYDTLVNYKAIDQNSTIGHKYRMYRKTSCHEVGHTVTLEHYDGPKAAGMQALAGAIASLALLGGCGTDVRDIEAESPPDLSVVHGALGAADYDVANSPEVLIEKREAAAEIGWDINVIAIGAVEEIVQGRDLWTEPSDEEPEHLLVLRVRVSEVLLADDQIADERVYVELPQGGEGADGNPQFSLEEWNTAIPEGTRVMLFLADAYREPGSYKVDHAGRGVADGATLMQPDAQGLIFEYDGNVVTQNDGRGADLRELWGVSSFEEIAERVCKHLG